jgi:hypothetical protein
MLSEGKKLRKIRESELKRRDKLRLRELAARLKHAQAERSHARKAIAHYCKLGRQNVTARVRALREELRAALATKAAKMREAQRDRCAADQKAAQLELDQVIRQVRAELEQERQSFGHHYGRKASRSTSAERRAESDDEVERNLPVELVPVFRMVKRNIKPGPRRTRTEAFLDWAEENPDDVAAIMYEQADRDVRRLVAEQGRVAGRLRKGKKAYEDPAELAHALGAEVPF